jgi:hypothetical protein
LDSDQRIVIFEEDGSGDYKIAGMDVYGKGIVIRAVHNITGPFPEIIDEPEKYVTASFKADLVLNFLRHPDLSEYLVSVCMKKDIPVIASGQQIPGAICPFTCCGLGRKKGLGNYAKRFGVPEYRVSVRNNRISSIEVTRGASCGATWQVTRKLTGLATEEALHTIGREVQYICTADPAAFDPVTGHSALHFAGDVHISALKKALNNPDQTCL